MRFLKVKLIGKDGNPGGFFWVNPRKVVGVMDAKVPGQLSGPAGEPIAEHKAALDLGDKIIVVDALPRELVEMLELGLL